MGKRIALYNVDSKYPNLPLMKLSTYHKLKGDTIEWYSPLLHHDYDLIYASKIFTNSDFGYLRKDMIAGGSGIFLKKKLPDNIEHLYPDYTLYPGIDFAMGFMTRGCIRKCAFCIVSQKEGNIRFNAHLKEFCREQKKVMLLDNNILAYAKHLDLLQELINSKKKIDINQGLDIRLITNKNANLLSKIKRWEGKELRFAFDDPELEEIIIKKTKILQANGIKRGRFYVLIGFNTTKEEDFKRIKLLQDLGHRIYIMSYKRTKYTIKVSRWVNRHFYHHFPFEQYV